MTNFKYLVLLFLGLYTVYSVRTECLTEACAEKLIASIDAQYRANSNYEYDHPDDVISVDIKLRDKLLAYKTSLDKFDWENFQNPLLKRQFEILSRDWKYPETTEEFRQDTELLKTVGKRKFTCSLFCHNYCKFVSYDREIKSILTNGDKPEYIKWYWREWRNRVPANVRIALKNYISYYQNLATPTKSPSAVWYENYDDPNMLEELENYMTAIRPLYQQMHGHLRQALREKFGNDIIPASGLIPHHLFEEALYQAWKKDSLLVNPYPEKKLPNLQQELNKNWGPSDLITNASHFFNMLGFPPYPRILPTVSTVLLRATVNNSKVIFRKSNMKDGRKVIHHSLLIYLEYNQNSLGKASTAQMGDSHFLIPTTTSGERLFYK
ncbi:angiotensin-converting enzyme-like [Haematobia irritans]|uniref:angiotensin-converting enzyme-like n=1 Tax=Haematobia irritans TaxID=7368 RepID=UPI003F500629